MVGRILKYITIFILMLCGQNGFAQGHLFSRVSINTNSVYVGQPVEVSVSVHTSTWFTKGVNPGNIKVNDAFTVYFRSVNSSERINGKTYSGVRMIFHVFPYSNDDIIFPSLDINVESPKEGTSKGVASVIKTKPVTIKVKPVPPNLDRDKWMVSPEVSVSENWIGNIRQVKVGDVIERNITVDAQWLVAELIPPVMWDTVQGVSIYPSRAEVNNNKTRTSISASRKDGVKYLFEKEGKVIIPEKVVTWWNPKISRLQQRTLKNVEIEVLPNPDLGMLESIKDSLTVLNKELIEEEKEKAAFSFLGLTLKQIIFIVIGFFIVTYILYKSIPPLIQYQKRRRERYLKSELFYFRKFEESLKKNDKNIILNHLYLWLDHLNLKEPTIDFFIKNYGSDILVQRYCKPEKPKYREFKEAFADKKQWQIARDKYLKHKKNTASGIAPLWINP